MVTVSYHFLVLLILALVNAAPLRNETNIRDKLGHKNIRTGNQTHIPRMPGAKNSPSKRESKPKSGKKVKLDRKKERNTDLENKTKKKQHVLKKPKSIDHDNDSMTRKTTITSKSHNEASKQLHLNQAAKFETKRSWFKRKDNRGRENSLEARAAHVINGRPVTGVEEFPFVVDLSASDSDISSQRFCTGSIVHESLVMTAAHCVLNDGYRSAVYATVGRVELEDGHVDNFHSETYRTIASMVHPNYTGIGSPFDVALLLLNTSSKAPVIKLSNKTPVVGTEVWVVGYGIQRIGTLEETGQPVEILSGRLQKTNLKIESRSFCDIPDVDLFTEEGLLCTTGVQIGSSACRGDSGGPLTHKTGKRAVQVGITSYGDAQCAAEQAGVFTDVASVHGWIDEAKRRLLSLLNTASVTLGDQQPDAEHSSHIGLHPEDSSDNDETKQQFPYSKTVHSEGVKFYKVKTNFTSPHKVRVSLCEGPPGHTARLMVRNETDKSVVHDSGSCPDGKLSQVILDTTSDALVVGVAGNHSVPYKLTFSAKKAK